jgi:hypothetical protein
VAGAVFPTLCTYSLLDAQRTGGFLWQEGMDFRIITGYIVYMNTARFVTSRSADLTSDSVHDRHLYKAYYSTALLTVLFFP